MSRKFKDQVVANITAVGGGAMTNTEQLSGADLEQLRLAARNGVATTSSGTSRTLGTNPRYPGTPNNGALSGADLEAAATK